MAPPLDPITSSPTSDQEQPTISNVLIVIGRGSSFSQQVSAVGRRRFTVKGACIGDVFLASDVAFHDRRIPIPVFDQYGVGARATFPTPNLGAAIAYVSDLLSVPVIFVKAITDIVDGDKPTSEEFLENLSAVSLALDKALTQVVDFLNGKRLSDL